MAKNKRNRRLSPAPSSVATAPQVGAFSAHPGAAFSTRRGQIFWPTTDTRLEVDAFSHAELRRRIHFLHAGMGIVRGFINNSADLIGWKTPQAKTGDPTFDTLAEQRFRDAMGTAEAFDVAAKFDFTTAQLMLSRCALKDGDVLTVLTESEGKAARFMFYEAHQLANPKNADKTWSDGIQTLGGRHVAYGLRQGDTGDVTVFPARNVIYYGEFDCPGRHRAIPPLAHAVNHATDITEVWADLKTGIKTSALFGAVIERDGGGQNPISKGGLPMATGTATSAVDGTPYESGKVWGGGSTISRLNPGEKINILTDGRPHPNSMEFVETLIFDMATGFGLPVEVIGKMMRLTGPGVRFVMDRADRWIKCRQLLQERWARRVWTYFIAKEIKAGRLPMPQGGRWWGVKFTSQRNLTIDRAKEARQRQDAIDQGLGTAADWYEVLDGADWQEQYRQRIAEVKFGLQECAAEQVPYDLVFKPRQGAAPAATLDPDAMAAAMQDSTPAS